VKYLKIKKTKVRKEEIHQKDLIALVPEAIAAKMDSVMMLSIEQNNGLRTCFNYNLAKSMNRNIS